MKAIRQSLRDNIVATTFVALICAFLMLQGMLAGFTRSAMASSSDENMFGVICSSSGASHVDGQTDDGSSNSKMGDCPCANLCRVAANTLPAVPVLGADPIVQPSLDWKAVGYSIKPLQRASNPALHSEARAPPAIS